MRITKAEVRDILAKATTEAGISATTAPLDILATCTANERAAQ